MAQNEIGQLKIRYVNGEEHLYEYVRVAAESPTIGKLMQELLQARVLVLELDESTLFVPFDNVLSIEVAPPPVKIPSIAVKKVHQIK